MSPVAGYYRNRLESERERTARALNREGPNCVAASAIAALRRKSRRSKVLIPNSVICSYFGVRSTSVHHCALRCLQVIWRKHFGPLRLECSLGSALHPELVQDGSYV